MENKGVTYLSLQYDEYLRTHLENVRNALNWMYEHNIYEEADISLLGLKHDASKFTAEEYPAYDWYFYGNDDKTQEEINKAFDYAWIHHIHNNQHHWQHWLLLNDDGSSMALEMPARYVYEMIADWWSFSWKNDNLYEVFDFYESHRPKMILNANTAVLIEETLSKIREALDNGQKEYELLKP